MFDLEKLDESIRDERQLKALIGMGRREFDFLIDLFSEAQLLLKEEAYQLRKKQQETEPEPGTKHVRKSSKAKEPRLNTNTKKLFYLLYYLKTYPTFDVLGFAFGMPRSTAHHNLYQVIPVLKKLLVTLGITPKRAIQSIEDLKETFGGDILNLIIDGTERRYFRHKDSKKQEENYSGKKSVTPRRTL